jgi:hypothetical protein
MQARLDPASRDRYPRPVPPARSDRRLLLVSGVLVVVAGVVFAAALFFATGGGQAAPKTGPVYFGVKRDIVNRIRQDHQPIYSAHPFGGIAFYFDLENNQLVALIARRPGTKSCVVAWRNLRRGYFDCHDHQLRALQLDRYQLTFPQLGAKAGGVIVDFRHVTGAPEPLPVP